MHHLKVRSRGLSIIHVTHQLSLKVRYPEKKWRGGGCIVTLEEIETFIKQTNLIVLEQHKRQREILIYMQGSDLC